MKRCPKCQKQYDDSWEICLKCNVKLVKDLTNKLPEDILSEFRTLKNVSSSLNENIKRLEGKIDSIIKGEKLPQFEKIEKTPSVEQKPSQVPHPEIISEKAAIKISSLESRIGRVWFNRVGVLAIIIGVGFFLKYAFDNNWIGELGRILLGLLAGMGMLGAGEITHRKNYRTFSEGLITGGASVLYLSIYAAFNFYHIIGVIPAFIFMTVVTFFIGSFAIHFDSPRVIGMTIIGGFLTPYLISMGGVHPAAFMMYILLFDIGILTVSYFKKWEYCNIAALLLTYCTYFVWFAAQYEEQYFVAVQFFLAELFILFSLIAVLYNFVRKQKTTSGDMSIVILNGIFYFLAVFNLLSGIKIPLGNMAFVSVGLASIYLIFVYSAFKRTQGEDKKLIFSYLSLTLLFATISLPIGLNAQWITIGAIIEFAVLIWLGFNAQIKWIRVVGLFLAAIALFKLLCIDSAFSIYGKTFLLIFNMRFLNYLTMTAAGLISAYLYKQNRDKISEDETWIATFLFLSASIVLLIGFSMEISSYFNRLITAGRMPQISPYWAKKMAAATIGNAKQFSLSALWAVYSFALIIIGIFRKLRSLRIMALVLLMLTILKVFFVDMSEVSQIWRILSFIGLGVVLIITSLLYQKYKEKILGFVGKD